MPIYDYHCQECNHEFEYFTRGFEPGEIRCPSCQSLEVEKLLASPLITIGKGSEPSSEFSAKEAELDYYKDRKDYGRAAKAAEKAGKSDWEVKDLYHKTGKKI